MSKVKVQKTNATGPIKAKTEKAETGAKGAKETTKSADTIVAKTGAAPKSASQSSISHFSSVSTPAYKEGWESIFGRSKIDHRAAANTDNSEHLPEKLTIHDVDIDKELRSALYKAFQKLARAQGISLAKIKKQIEFEYILDCNLKKK